jgi:hypothetical protein
MSGLPLKIGSNKKGQDCGLAISLIENSGDNDNPVTQAVITNNARSFIQGHFPAAYPDSFAIVIRQVQLWPLLSEFLWWTGADRRGQRRSGSADFKY